ncbi:MAG: MarR family transcriptional regulator [Clostridia bacterium]|nr:MarR family transcriptional regulator [Clostridia bacterium]MBR2302321.1 MarR family transcriptional regulator [Clostridia bacterium]
MDKYLHANIVLSKFSRDYIDLKNDLPIRPSEMGVLNLLVKREGKYTPLAIADMLGVSKTMVAAHIAVLEKGEYITKQPSETDKRSFFVLPTEKAKRLVAEVDNRLDSQLKFLEQTMGADMFDALITLADWAQKTIEKM